MYVCLAASDPHSMRGLIIASIHFVGLLRRWDWYPLMAGVHKVAEQDGSFGASGIGTHCADAEFMRDWYPHQVHLES